jgi:hypothetical protein
VSGPARYKPALANTQPAGPNTTRPGLASEQTKSVGDPITHGGSESTDRPATKQQPARLNPHDSSFDLLAIKLNYPYVSRLIDYIL